MIRILIIERDAEIRRKMAAVLRLKGFEPLLAADGRQGVLLATQETPALILCEVILPYLDGHRVISILRQNALTAHIPFIFQTARGRREEIRAGMNVGADDYLVKPVTTRELLLAIGARLQREKQRTPPGFRPDFSSARPLQALGLTPREAEVLLWVAQGKSNPDLSVILGATEHTVKKHLQNIFAKLGVESRTAATIIAFERLPPLGPPAEAPVHPALHPRKKRENDSRERGSESRLATRPRG